MILPDTNVLLYAVNENAPQHTAARAWFESQLAGTETVGLAWSVLTGFLRVSTRPSVFERPLTVQTALSYLDEWLGHPATEILHPGHRHQVLLRELLEPIGTAGNLVTDAHLAALAIEHGGAVASTDRDFGRFPRLRWINPLEAGNRTT